MTDVTTSNPLPPFAQNVVAGLARHVLTGIAGGLMVTAGLSTSTQAQIITAGVGIILWLIGYLWSYIEKFANANPAVAVITGVISAVGAIENANTSTAAQKNSAPAVQTPVLTGGQQQAAANAPQDATDFLGG